MMIADLGFLWIESEQKLHLKISCFQLSALFDIRPVTLLEDFKMEAYLMLTTFHKNNSPQQNLVGTYLPILQPKNCLIKFLSSYFLSL